MISSLLPCLVDDTAYPTARSDGRSLGPPSVDDGEGLDVVHEAEMLDEMVFAVEFSTALAIGLAVGVVVHL